MPSQGLEIADAVGDFGQIESGNHLSATGPMRQQGFKRSFLDERADDADLNGIHENSRFQFLAPSCIGQPDQSRAHHAVLADAPLTACCQT